jgi:hypothetical protein
MTGFPLARLPIGFDADRFDNNATMRWATARKSP